MHVPSTTTRSRARTRRRIAAVVAVAATILTPAVQHASAANVARSAGDFRTGWYDTLSGSANLPAIRSEGMNSVMPYFESGADITAYLNTARESGVQVYVEIDRAIVRAGDTAAIRTFVARYATHPGLAGWYLADEPSINPTLGPLSAATAERLYGAVKATDPAHPVVIAFSTADDINAYRNAYDIAMWDEYPARKNAAEFTGLDAWRYRLMQRAGATSDKLGFVPIIQAFTPGQTGPTSYYRLPTNNEARYMTYSAVQSGATGVFYWTRYRSTWTFANTVIKPLTSELNRLGPALKAGAVVGVASVSQGGPAVVARTYRNPSTGRYSVVVVNHSAQQVSAQLSIATTLGLRWAQPVGGTAVTITGGKIGATLKPYEARTYDLS